MASDTPDPAALARELIRWSESAGAIRIHWRGIIANAVAIARWALTMEAVIKDGCETEAEARQIAASVLGEARANGDGYGVPGVADLMEMMRERVAALEAALDQSRCICSTNPCEAFDERCPVHGHKLESPT